MTAEPRPTLGPAAFAAAPSGLELPVARLHQVRLEMSRVVVGQERALERLLVAVLADGHCLLEGVPGLGKTLALSTLARVIGGSFSRIQFTADLIPSDIVGTRIYRQSSETFDVEPGPILANVVLADEINRTGSQSALLGCGEPVTMAGAPSPPLPVPRRWHQNDRVGRHPSGAARPSSCWWTTDATENARSSVAARPRRQRPGCSMPTTSSPPGRRPGRRGRAAADYAVRRARHAIASQGLASWPGC
jgi:hypothetical protein